MVGGKRREMGLGNYPGVTLAQARDKAREFRDLIRQGVDPVERQRAAQSALRAAAAAALTFEQCAQAYIEAHEAGWANAKHGQQWRNTLSTYVYPIMGSLLVRDVQKEHVLAALQPIWKTKTQTALRVRGRIELVLSYAMQAGYRPEGLNPARWKGGLDKLLPPPSKITKERNQPAVQLDHAGDFALQLRQREGMGARALEFLMLTAVRSHNVRAATWAEFDLDSAVWEIPGEGEGGSAQRMKSGRAHRVPLSKAAVALLRGLPLGDGGSLVFPAPRGGMLSDMTLSAVMRRMEFRDKDGRRAVPHGLRSTFRDWAAERTNHSREVAEMALAHIVDNKVEASYRRGDLFEKRRQLMEDWASFLAKPVTPAKVIPMRKQPARALESQRS
jgi:integrase